MSETLDVLDSLMIERQFAQGKQARVLDIAIRKRLFELDDVERSFLADEGPEYP